VRLQREQVGCYDLVNIFAEKLSKKIVVFDSKQS
jgi:hypothetical protein